MPVSAPSPIPAQPEPLRLVFARDPLVRPLGRLLVADSFVELRHEKAAVPLAAFFTQLALCDGQEFAEPELRLGTDSGLGGRLYKAFSNGPWPKWAAALTPLRGASQAPLWRRDRGTLKPTRSLALRVDGACWADAGLLTWQDAHRIPANELWTHLVALVTSAGWGAKDLDPWLRQRHAPEPTGAHMPASSSPTHSPARSAKTSEPIPPRQAHPPPIHEPQDDTSLREVAPHLKTAQFLGWFHRHSTIDIDTAYAEVQRRAEYLRNTPPSQHWQRAHARSALERNQIATALERYYGASATAGTFYRARTGSTAQQLSILIQNAAHLTYDLPLEGPHSRASFHPAPPPSLQLDHHATAAALQRLAEVEVAGTTLVDRPLYRLLDLNMTATGMCMSFSESTFLNYALTADLLEGELVEGCIAPQSQGAPLPLRANYLPTLESAFNLSNRLCVGGVQALFAAARHDEGDYVLLVQMRSSRVLNMTGRLALIPKAFHQPVIETTSEVDLYKTVKRELEEELLGRQDLEMLEDDRRGDPLHPTRFSEPMRWLHEHRSSGSYQVNSTGFGINMVTGNYEFPCLIAIHDPAWWTRYSPVIEANWETARLLRYSSLDTAGLTALALDPRWSNEE